ncbi:MAG: hypothetical protein KGM44_02080 [bacterium]|nr:hypothetical protein [bacterium]
MQDRPDAGELIAAVRSFLEHEVLPTQSDQRGRFRTLVAANALAIVQRELAAGASAAQHEGDRLRALLGSQDGDVRALRLELARHIRAGEADESPRRDAVYAATLASVEAKLAIANPKLLELVQDGG